MSIDKNQHEKFTKAITEFQKNNPNITSGDLQTFTLGFISGTQTSDVGNDELVSDVFVYRNHFMFQKMVHDGMWYVTYLNQIINRGQYRHDLQEWIDTNYYTDLI